MVIKIHFTTVEGVIFCTQEHSGGMAAAISYVESLKGSFIIWDVDVRFPGAIFVTMEGGPRVEFVPVKGGRE